MPQFKQYELPSDVFNSSVGDVRNWNGQQWKVTDTSGGMRTLEPLGASGGDFSSFDPVAQAQKLQDFYKQQNQPAIQTLQTQYNPATGSGALVDKYNSLLDSIKGQGSVAANQQILASNTNLGARGIVGESALGQQEIASALLPVTTQYAGLTAQTGLSEQQDLGQLAAQIASLQAGNPAAAIQGATAYGGQLQAAQAIQQQVAAQLALGSMEYAYRMLPAGAQLYNPSSGQYLTGGQTFSPVSSGGGYNASSPRQAGGVDLGGIFGFPKS